MLEPAAAPREYHEHASRVAIVTRIPPLTQPIRSPDVQLTPAQDFLATVLSTLAAHPARLFSRFPQVRQEAFSRFWLVVSGMARIDVRAHTDQD